LVLNRKLLIFKKFEKSQKLYARLFSPNPAKGEIEFHKLGAFHPPQAHKRARPHDSALDVRTKPNPAAWRATIACAAARH
jgi:hypothetical protein